MNIKLPGFLLLSAMLCATNIVAHDFSSKTILKSYVESKDIKLVSQRLSHLNYKELSQLEKDVLTVQLQGKGEDLGPVLKEIKNHKRKIYIQLGALAVVPFIGSGIILPGATNPNKLKAYGAGVMLIAMLGMLPAVIFIQYETGWFGKYVLPGYF